VSLFIDPKNVTAVLLSDGWHEVQPPGSFDLDSYEFGYTYDSDDGWYPSESKTVVLHGGGNSGVCATGFTFSTVVGGTPGVKEGTVVGGTPVRMYGPLTAVLAVRTVSGQAS
jgi:hypothetical protein